MAASSVVDVRASRVHGAPGGIRTPDARLRTAALYPLSYGGGAGASLPHRPTLSAPPREEADCRAAAGAPSIRSYHPRMPLPVLYVRDGCHLCEEASVLLDEMLGREGWESVDIGGDDELLLRYAHRIPVLVVAGVERAELIVTRPDLEAILGR